MIAQLVRRRAAQMAAGSQAIVPTPSQIDAAIPGTLDEILTADPVDLALHMEQVWDLANVWAPSTRPVGKGRRALIELGAFNDLAPSTHPAWHHLGYSFCIENTRATQIVKRVVHAFRSGEGLGHPSVATQRWLDATEALLFGAVTLLGTSMSTSAVRPDPEAVRRNAYWRMFGMQLAFGGDDGKPAAFDKAETANLTFVPAFEGLLRALWQASEHRRGPGSITSTANDRIVHAAEQVGFLLRSRRPNGVLSREELTAATAMGWIEATFSADTPVIVDLRAQSATPADRLRLVGERVGLAPHGQAGAFLAMAPDLSVLLRTLESGAVKDRRDGALLYSTASPAIGATPRRVVTEWSAATGRSLTSAHT